MPFKILFFEQKNLTNILPRKSAAGGEISQEPTIHVRSRLKKPADHLYISRDLSNLNVALKNELIRN